MVSLYSTIKMTHGPINITRMFFSPSLRGRIWRPTWPRVEWVPEVKLEGRVANHLPHTNAFVWSAMRCTPTRRQIHVMGCGNVCCLFMPYTESLLYLPIIVCHFPPGWWPAGVLSDRTGRKVGGQRVAARRSEVACCLH